MKIVKMQGGLGNQMFQYAFAKALEKKGHDVYLDLSLYNKNLIRNGINYVHNGFELAELFEVDCNVASEKQVKKLGTLADSFFNRLRRKYLTKKTHYIDKIFKYTPAVLEDKKDCYLDGYWQTEKYFESFASEIRSAFQFKKSVSEKTQSAMLQITENTASLHVRRGDYLNGGLHDVCTKEYFNTAIYYAMNKSGITNFLIFSNDIEWCKNNLDYQNCSVTFVDWNSGEASWQDMALMTHCRVNIISNSSFSWWSGWLNQCKDKVVIAPNFWNRRELGYKDTYYRFDYSDIVPKSWIRLPI